MAQPPHGMKYLSIYNDASNFPFHKILLIRVLKKYEKIKQESLSTTYIYISGQLKNTTTRFWAVIPLPDHCDRLPF